MALVKPGHDGFRQAARGADQRGTARVDGRVLIGLGDHVELRLFFPARALVRAAAVPLPAPAGTTPPYRHERRANCYLIVAYCGPLLERRANAGDAEARITPPRGVEGPTGIQRVLADVQLSGPGTKHKMPGEWSAEAGPQMCSNESARRRPQTPSAKRSSTM
jgi:hypothetical protein